MENGNRISETIQKLQSIDRKWERYLLDEEVETDDEVSELMDRLFATVRQELKKNSEANVRTHLLAEHMSEKAVDKFIADIQETLEFYTTFSFLRDLEEKDEMELRGLLSTIYQKYIVRFESGYLNCLIDTKYEKDLFEIADLMKYLTDYYISKSYSVQGIIRDLQDETGLLKENCVYWANIIEQNYMVLKMDYIIRELERVRRQ